MNSNFNNFDFDLGIGSNSRSSKPLNEQKNKSNISYSYSTSSFSGSQPKTTPSWQPGKPAWTHQPAPSQPGVTRAELGGPASMVGDIMGKNWNSAAPAPQKVAVASSIGIVNKNPNLFGDLVNSALGQNKGGSNVPLKSVTPAKNSFSMGRVGDSLPKTGNASGYGIVGNGSGKIGDGSGWGSYQSSGAGSANNASSMNMGSGLGGASFRSGTTSNANMNMGSGLGEQSTGSGGGGRGMSSNKDPFGSFMDFSTTKPMKSSVGAGSTGIGSAGKGAATPVNDFDVGGYQNAPKSNPSTLRSNASSVPKMNDFRSQNQPASVPSSGANSFDVLFSSVSATGSANAASGSGAGGEPSLGGHDWGFEGAHDDGGTTELDGLPPPPAGVSASAAKTKGLDNYKQGQYADSIKWLSWAIVLLERAGESVGTMEVLSCRASCYKEVGEYKKAVADCTKVLDDDEKNVAVLVQRALLYESMEKYRLGADDLRTVMKLDPGNRVARNTIHRLNKMADQ